MSGVVFGGWCALSGLAYGTLASDRLKGWRFWLGAVALATINGFIGSWLA